MSYISDVTRGRCLVARQILQPHVSEPLNWYPASCLCGTNEMEIIHRIQETHGKRSFSLWLFCYNIKKSRGQKARFSLHFGGFHISVISLTLCFGRLH